MPYFTVSQDKNGYWYCHRYGFPHLPHFGSFSKSKRKALQFAADAMGMTYKQYMEYKGKRTCRS